MSQLINMALAAALGFALSASLYAADTPRAAQAKQTTAMSDAEVSAAMAKCDKLTGTEHAKCVVNIRPTPAGSKAAMTTGSSSEENVVKDGNAVADEEYLAAVKECEAAKTTDKDRCIKQANQHFGRD